jgi:hypothetical protein
MVQWLMIAVIKNYRCAESPTCAAVRYSLYSAYEDMIYMYPSIISLDLKQQDKVDKWIHSEILVQGKGTP